MMVKAWEMPDVLIENSTFWPRVKQACGLASIYHLMAVLIFSSSSSQNSAARAVVHGVTCSTRISHEVR